MESAQQGASSASSPAPTLKASIEIRKSEPKRSSSFDEDKVEPYDLFTKSTVACVYGMQPKAVQSILFKFSNFSNNFAPSFSNVPLGAAHTISLRYCIYIISFSYLSNEEF